MEHLRKTMVNVIDQKIDLESAVSSVLLGSGIHAQKEVLAFAATGNKAEKEKTKRNDKKEKPDPKNCVFCKAEHYSTDCTKFPTAELRKKQLPRNACFGCLRQGHSARQCNSRFGCYYCKKKGHASALCYEKFPSSEKPKLEPSEKQESTKPEAKETKKEERSVHLAVHEKGLLLTARMIIENPDTGARLKARVFMDPGADGSYVLHRVRHILHLPVVGTKKLKVSTFLANTAKHLDTETVKLRLRSNIDSKFKLDVVADTVMELPYITTFDTDEFVKSYPIHNDLNYAETGNGDDVTIMIVIDYFWNVLWPKSIIQVNSAGLFLVNSAFGWLVSGRTTDTSLDRSVNTACTSIQETLSNFWSLEAIGIRDPNVAQDREEELALTSFKAALEIDPIERRYTVRWPWREHPPPLPTNYGLAVGTVRSLFRRTKPEHLQIIKDTFQKQLATGIIEEVSNAQPTVGMTHYLPYHLVVKDKSSPTPVRIVYNGSARTKASNRSLNDCLFKGLNLLPNLLHVLLRFRFGKVVAVADVEKAFHQIVLQAEERDYLRFLAINDTNEENIVTYRFKRVPFGVISSPFMLAGVIHDLFDRNTSPLAEKVKQNLYVDNLILTFDNVQDAIRLQRYAVEVFDSVSMNLRMWNSNACTVRDAVPPERRDTSTDISILGVNWNTESDHFTMVAPSAGLKNLRHTMRSVLKLSAQVFDPLGLCCPITIRAKILLRSLHERKAQWDENLTKSESNQWSNILDDLLKIPELVVHRMISSWPDNSVDCQLHVFADASKNAYATALYVRLEQKSENRITTKLIFAKSRSTPLKDKALTIPKLELLGAVSTTRAIRLIRDALPFLHEQQTFLWLDSMCVLAWLKAKSTQTTFVKNRIAEIHQTTNLTYRYVPTADNIADLPT